MNPLAPYLLYLKLGLLAVLLAVLTFAGYKVNSWHKDSLHMAAVEAQAAQEIAQARQAQADLLKRFNEAQKASSGYQDELRKSADNRSRLDSLPVPVVRLCKPAPSMSSTRPGSSGPTQEASPSVEQPGQAGPDIGKPLYGLADDADQREAELGAQIRALQGLLVH